MVMRQDTVQVLTLVIASVHTQLKVEYADADTAQIACVLRVADLQLLCYQLQQSVYHALTINSFIVSLLKL